MSFGIIILIRVLFAASMVFIIGYVFGGFSKKATLRTITKIASILVIVLFIFLQYPAVSFWRLASWLSS